MGLKRYIEIFIPNRKLGDLVKFSISIRTLYHRLVILQ